MKEVFVIYGRKESVVVGYFENANQCETMDVYGAFQSFESALAEFKKLVGEARDEFCEIVPADMEDEILEKTKEADLFEDFDPSCGDEDLDLFDEDCNECGNHVKWSCSINEGSNAAWEMFLNSDDPTDIPLLPKLYIVEVEVK